MSGEIIPRKARVADIVAIAAKMSGVAASEITGPRQYQRIARVRQACYVVARRAGHSYPQIGLRMNRDHSSVVHGVRYASAIAERDERFRAFIERLDGAALNAAPFVQLDARIADAIPDKVEPIPSFIATPRKPDLRPRNDFRDGDQPDNWLVGGDDMIVGSAALAAAIKAARAVGEAA